MDTILANKGAATFGFAEAQLRSQNMLFTLLPMPAGMGGFAKTIVSHLKSGSSRRVHRQWHGLTCGGC